MAHFETATDVRLMNVVVMPDTPADATYARHRLRAEEIARGFTPDEGLDLQFIGGKTIPSLTYTNYYLGGQDAWEGGDIENIDRDLSAAMSDVGLNNVLAQYFDRQVPTTSFRPSRILSDPAPATMFKDTIEAMVAALHADGSLADFDLATTVFNFLLPSGIILSAGKSTAEEAATGRSEPTAHATLPPDFEQEEDDSNNGLGGYHGSIHAGGQGETVYYAVGVYSESRPEGDNGIVAFDEPWKNVVATFYHELVEARTDPDVEEAIRTRQERFLGWYSFDRQGGEIGDIPINESGGDLSTVFQEIELTDGTGTVPVQLMYSNAAHGPEGPIAEPH
jgi:hypothetical protein